MSAPLLHLRVPLLSPCMRVSLASRVKHTVHVRAHGRRSVGPTRQRLASRPGPTCHPFLPRNRPEMFPRAERSHVPSDSPVSHHTLPTSPTTHGRPQGAKTPFPPSPTCDHPCQTSRGAAVTLAIAVVRTADCLAPPELRATEVAGITQGEQFTPSLLPLSSSLRCGRDAEQLCRSRRIPRAPRRAPSSSSAVGCALGSGLKTTLTAGVHLAASALPTLFFPLVWPLTGGPTSPTH